MKADTATIDKDQLRATVNARYELDLVSLSFVPVGEDAYAYRGETAHGARYFVRVQPVSGVTDGATTYPYLPELQRQGVAGVLAPLTTREQCASITWLGYEVAVFPFVDGVTLHVAGAQRSDIQDAARILAGLHQATLEAGVRPETFGDPFQTTIEHLWGIAAQPDQGWSDLQRETARRLSSTRPDVQVVFERMQTLQTVARALPLEWVPTHGDPNRDNFLRARDGTLYLTDWGALALGPIERDLFAWTGDGFSDFLAAYRRYRPAARLHGALFEYYAYHWCLQEIADYASRILIGTQPEVELAHARQSLQAYLPFPHDTIRRDIAAVRGVLDAHGLISHG